MTYFSKDQLIKLRLLLSSAALLFTLGVDGISAAEVEDLRNSEHPHVKNLNNSKSSVAFDLSDAKLIASQLGLDQHNELRVIKETTDQKGVIHSRMRQYYQGVPVYGYQVIINSKSGMALKVRGKLVKGIANDVQDVSPSIDADMALSLVRKAGVATENEKTELTIYVGDDDIAKLAYFVSFFEATLNPSRPHFIIDATTGGILKEWDGLTHAE
jgi:Zn-dependent metalloprotease